MLDTNYEFSKEILRWCLDRKIPLVYASSASVYGAGKVCIEEPTYEAPINVYAYSKLQFDRYVRRLAPQIGSTVVGLRYFNVYGPREAHKGRMASMIWQLYHQLKKDGVCRLFTGTDGYEDGGQLRDFVAVSDVAKVNLFFAAAAPRVGVYNCGTGKARSFNDVANALIARLGRGRIEYVPFPDSLKGKYQSFTEADLTRLRAAGYEADFTELEDGVALMAGAL